MAQGARWHAAAAACASKQKNAGYNTHKRGTGLEWDSRGYNAALITNKQTDIRTSSTS
jgi:hypothetical protein